MLGCLKKIGIWVDYTHSNKSMLRQEHVLLAVDEALAKLANAFFLIFAISSKIIAIKIVRFLEMANQLSKFIPGFAN